MADATANYYPSTLGSALSGLRVSGAETPWGMGLMTLNQAAPALYNPYGSAGSNFAIALGQGLVSALLGYQARKQATEESIQATNLASQLLQTPTTKQASFLEALQQQDIPTNVMSRISDIAPAILQQQIMSEAASKAKEQDFNQALMLKGIEQGLIPTGKAGLFGGTGEQGADFLTNKKLDQYDELRNKFNALPEVKNYSLVKNAATVVGQAVKDPSSVATQELIRRAVQLIEPGMAVREGEQAAIAASQSIPDQWKGALEKAMNGEGGLQAPVREGILRIAQRSYEANAAQYTQAKDFYQNLAKERGLGNRPISYHGEAPTFEEVITSLSKNKPGTTGGLTTPPAANQSRINEIATRLTELSNKGKDNLTFQENEEVAKLANEYRNLKHAGSK